MNILFLITGLGGGGAEKVVVDLADQMSRLGHQVKIAYLKGEIIVRPKNSNIELFYIGLESLKNSKYAYLNYKRLILNFNPDVVHAHMVHANIFARIARKFTAVPKLICTAHSNNEGGKARMFAYRLTHKLSEVTTNVSHSASASFEQLGAVPKKGITTVYNGIDLDKFKYDPAARERVVKELNLDTDDILILAVGRFHTAKDYPNLLHAFAKTKQQQAGNSILIIAGDGEERPNIEQLISSLKLQHDVFLLGRRDDIPKLMSAVDLFVLSSSFEGFGLVVAEAMASNTFVIATDCGGVKEVMGGYGFLVPPQNSELLADKIRLAMKMHITDVNKNNKEALHHVQQNFNLDKIIQQWLEIYAS